MDWASNDPAYDPGLYFVPEEPGGISLLEEPEAAGRPAPRREGFYGTVVSSRRDQPAIEDADWDPRPLRFNPAAGPRWAQLAPPAELRPPRGGPTPFQAFPMVSQDEAQVGPRDMFAPGPAAGPAGAKIENFPRLPDAHLYGVLLIVAVVLVAQLFAINGRLHELALQLAYRAGRETGAARGGGSGPGPA